MDSQMEENTDKIDILFARPGSPDPGLIF